MRLAIQICPKGALFSWQMKAEVMLALPASLDAFQCTWTLVMVQIGARKGSSAELDSSQCLAAVSASGSELGMERSTVGNLR